MRCASPSSSTSVVDSTVSPGWRKRALPSALSSATVPYSENWMSKATALGLPLAIWSSSRRVHVARERPLLVQLVERHVVDLHDHDVERRRFIAAQRETEVDRLPLEVVEEAEVEDVRRRGRDDRAQRDEEEEPRPEAHLPRVHGVEDASVRPHS